MRKKTVGVKKKITVHVFSFYVDRRQNKKHFLFVMVSSGVVYNAQDFSCQKFYQL